MLNYTILVIAGIFSFMLIVDGIYTAFFIRRCLFKKYLYARKRVKELQKEIEREITWNLLYY